MTDELLQEQVDYLARTMDVLLERIRRLERQQHVHFLQSDHTQTEYYGQLPMGRSS